MVAPQRCIVPALLAFGSAAASLDAQSPRGALGPHLDIVLTVDISASRIDAAVEIRQPRCGQRDSLSFLLHRRLVLRQLQVDGIDATPVEDDSAGARQGLRVARGVTIPCGQRITVAYDGEGPWTEDGRNQVSDAVVELSRYGAWYPLLPGTFTYDLDLNMPHEAAFAANARLLGGRDSAAGRVHLAAREPVTDVAIVASTRLLEHDTTARGVTTAMLRRRDLDLAAQARATRAERTMLDVLVRLTGWLGPVLTPARGVPTLAFSVRGGPLSYARLPLVVIPESRLATDGDRPLPYPALAPMVAHEFAHFWSPTTNGSDRDEWIVEGLTEATAALYVREAFGAAAHATMLRARREWIAEAGPASAPPIVATAGSSQWVNANRYAKPALLMERVRAEAGTTRVRAFLRAIAGRARARIAVTTEDVLMMAAQTLGATSATRMRECLTTADWRVERCEPVLVRETGALRTPGRRDERPAAAKAAPTQRNRLGA